MTEETNKLLIDALEKRCDQGFAAQKEAVSAALASAEKATNKAEQAAERRFEGLNELRGMAADWRSEFARRETVDTQINSAAKELGGLRDRLTAVEQRSKGISDSWGVVGIVLGLLIAGTALFFRNGAGQ